MAGRPWPWPSTSCPAPTPWTWPTGSVPEDGGTEEALPRRREYQHRLRHHAVHPRVGQRTWSARCSRPSSWWPWWCWCSCKTGGRPSSRWWPCRWPSSAPLPSMAVLGFTLNNISLFGLVLAIGIVVDDAIVVVENVERWLEHGLAAARGGRKAMDEVTGPGRRRGPGPVRRVRALRVHRRHHRPVLPPVRRDHRRLDRLLGLQLADAEPGAGGLLLQAAQVSDASQTRGASTLLRRVARQPTSVVWSLPPGDSTRRSAPRTALYTRWSAACCGRRGGPAGLSSACSC